MITTFLHWSDDISKAPKGEYVTTTTTVLHKGKPVERTTTEHVPVKLLGLTSCGKIGLTYWRPAKLSQSGAVLEGDCWSGYVRGSGPVLWALYPDAAELLKSHEAITAAGDWSPYAEQDA